MLNSRAVDELLAEIGRLAATLAEREREIERLKSERMVNNG